MRCMCHICVLYWMMSNSKMNDDVLDLLLLADVRLRCDSLAECTATTIPA